MAVIRTVGLLMVVYLIPGRTREAFLSPPGTT